MTAFADSIGARRRLSRSAALWPTPEELAAEMGLEPRKVQWMMRVSLATAEP